MKPEFVYIESCDFINYPTGGTLSFAKQMLKVFGNRMALVGFCEDKRELGRWSEKEIDCIKYQYFGIQLIRKNAKKPFIPARISSYYALKKYIKIINTYNIKRVFTRTPQFTLLLDKKYWDTRCFCFAGTTNSVEISRYPFLRKLSALYEKKLFKALHDFDSILAAADSKAIKSLTERSNGLLKQNQVNVLTTRFDQNIFFPLDRIDSRNKLGLSKDIKIFITTGRLSWVKGWELLINAFIHYLSINGDNCHLYFVGEGEDRNKIEKFINEKKLSDKIFITGKVLPDIVNLYLNAADIYLVGSFYEGWSNAMIEALGTGCTFVSTNVSGSDEMIQNGKNGYILYDRNAEKMSELISNALELENSKNISVEISKKYTLSTLSTDIERLWLNKFSI